MRSKQDDNESKDLATYITSHAEQHGLHDDLAVLVLRCHVPERIEFAK